MTSHRVRLFTSDSRKSWTTGPKRPRNDIISILMNHQMHWGHLLPSLYHTHLLFRKRGVMLWYRLYLKIQSVTKHRHSYPDLKVPLMNVRSHAYFWRRIGHVEWMQFKRPKVAYITLRLGMCSVSVNSERIVLVTWWILWLLRGSRHPATSCTSVSSSGMSPRGSRSCVGRDVLCVHIQPTACRSHATTCGPREPRSEIRHKADQMQLILHAATLIHMRASVAQAL